MNICLWLDHEIRLNSWVTNLNSLTTPRGSTLLLQKLSRLAVRLQQEVGPKGTNQDFATLESSVTEAYKILSQFYKDLSAPIYKPENAMVDSVPTAKAYNNNFIAIGDDLKTIYAELQNMQGVTLANFNYMASRMNRLQGKLKNVSSLLGDFILFSDLATKDALFFSDSFNNTRRIEVNSPLLNKEQCEIDQDQGILTLPIDRKAQTKITISDTPVINSNSNGVIGNNQELGASFHGNISDILDNNADTWFEYERVVTIDDGVSLILDLTISLGEPRVVNFIRINPNNFGTRTPVEIVSLDTSLDGKVLTSIKDDIPIADFITQDEENTFVLAGSTSKFSGQGLFTFTPRKIKYVHITLRQNTPYLITSLNGTLKNRYAIGIRDVEVAALPYKSEGEIISTSFISTDEIRKLVLLSSQNPDPSTTSLLASIDHFVSPDNGVSWYQIRPKVSAGTANTTQTIPEVLDFNGVGPNAISTTSPVFTLRYKATLKRNVDAFNSNTSELAQEKENTSDLFTLPASAPFVFKLQKIAIPDSISVLDPDIGTFYDRTSSKAIAVGTGNKLVVPLPFDSIPMFYSKSWDGTKWITNSSPNFIVTVGGVEWSSGLLTGTNKNYLLTTKQYSQSKLGLALEFGDGTSGAAVGQGQVISICFDNPAILSPSRGERHESEIPFPAARDTSRALLFTYDPSETRTDILKKGAKTHKLKALIQSTSDTVPDTTGKYRMIFSDTGVFNTAVPFKDGSSEFSGSGQYSVDFTSGYVYSRDPVASTGDTTVTYVCEPITAIDKNDWSFVTLENGKPGVSISDKAYRTFPVLNEPVESSTNYFSLGNLSIVPGTIIFKDATSGELPEELSKEVSYIDGHQELLGVIKTSEQLGSNDSTGNISIPLNMKIVSDPTLQIQFSRTDLFLSKKANVGSLSIAGDWCVEYPSTYPPTGRIVVKLTTLNDDLGSVSYYYQDPQTILTNRYSVNYKTGEVYTYSTTPSNVVADYEYTSYGLIYTAARSIPKDDWEFDATNNTVTLKDREVLANFKIPSIVQAGGAGSTKMYEVDYQYIKTPREDVSELEPYFSPVLRDYALKVIPKSRLL